jgi:hypothetical protein
MARKKTIASVSAPKARAKRSNPLLPSGYVPFLEDLKRRIRTAQVKAVFSVNREMIGLYWHIGKSIVDRQRVEGWGKAIVRRLAEDLQKTFPGIGGFSPLNIWRMRAFYLAWNEEFEKLSRVATELDSIKLSQLVTEIPWGQNMELIFKLKDPAIRLWYARKTVEHGWSRAVLVHQIESGLHERQGKAISNFTLTLPPPQSDLAQQTLKDPWRLEREKLTAEFEALCEEMTLMPVLMSCEPNPVPRPPRSAVPLRAPGVIARGASSLSWVALFVPLIAFRIFRHLLRILREISNRGLEGLARVAVAREDLVHLMRRGLHLGRDPAEQGRVGRRAPVLDAGGGREESEYQKGQNEGERPLSSVHHGRPPGRPPPTFGRLGVEGRSLPSGLPAPSGRPASSGRPAASGRPAPSGRPTPSGLPTPPGRPACSGTGTPRARSSA